ncbi:conserved hypothetical protein [Echinococcus multilocularis]|uniref:Trichohyalin-plectin-homology domain-containing protein n=1 Tax=Echinococcus multilocularis TaxID=6211 RepID=A0A068YC95_ECHMU|nr:conserved hypothetical protein [Echinococcus multilocularis]
MFALNTPDLRAQILRHRALHPDRFRKCRKAEAGRAQKIKELSQLNNVIRTAGKATVDSRTQVLKHMLEARDQECRFLDEIKQKEVASAQMCSPVDEKLAQFVDKEYSINATCADPTIALLDDDPRLKEFARRIRSKAMSLIQRAQIIENQQRRENQAMEIKEQEKCWLEEYTAKNCEMELKERLKEINKKKDFREGIIKQISTHPSKDCTNFEAEKKRCEEVLAKELAEIKAEKEATFHQKEALKRSTLEELSRRKKELSDRKQDELEFEMKKLLEQEALNVAIDAGRDTWSKNVEANRRRQELAALKLVEMQHAAESSLSKQAAKASSEIEIGRAILVSAQEADEVLNETKQRAKQQRDYCNELDRVLELKKMAIKEEKDREKELDRIYLEACKQEETKLKNEDKFQRTVGLQMGKCLRDQIEAREDETRKSREREREAERMLVAQQRDWDGRVEAAKEKLLADFAAWKNSLTPIWQSGTPTGSEVLGCQPQPPGHCTSTWMSETQDQFGKWHPERPLHPFLLKRK